MRVLKIVWAKWQIFGHKLATVQARILLSLFYFLILGPFAVVLKLAADPLHLRAAGSRRWTPREQPPGEARTLARRQY